MQGISTFSLPEVRAFTPGSLVRGRVVQAGGQSFFEYAGGRIALPASSALAKSDAVPAGWHTYKIEQKPDGIRLTLLPDAKGAPPLASIKQAQNSVFQAGGKIERLLRFLYPERKLIPKASGNEGKKPLAHAFFKTFFSLEPDALERIMQSIHGRADDRQKTPAGFNEGMREDGAAEGANKKPPAPCLLRLDMPFIQEGGIPIFVVPQDGEGGTQKAIWLFSEIELEGLGHTAFCLRYTKPRLDGEIFCQKGRKQAIEGCLPDSLSSIRVYEQDTREEPAFCEWALMRIMQACPGECDTYA
jgi:hypothetical protein